MLGEDEFLNGVPKFLRREAQPDRPRTAAAKPANGSTPPVAPKAAEVDTPAIQHPKPTPEAPPKLAAEAQPAPMRPRPPKVAAPETTPPMPLKGRPELVADNGRRVEPEEAVKAKRPKAGGDSPFQVTLPRELIRQIRVRAAEEDTTHRAIILRSLKLYGFSIPDGEDIDRRKVVARRG